MTEREAFIEAIAAEPEEDTPRLAFADWLQEHGEEDRAEFVRLMHELFTRPPSAEWPSPPPDDIQRLQDRVQALLELRGPIWLEPFCRALGVDETAPARRDRWGTRLWRRLTGKPQRTGYSLKDIRFGFGRIEGWDPGPIRSLGLWLGFVNELELCLASPLPVRDVTTAFRLEPVDRLSIRLADNPDQWQRLNAPCLARVAHLTVEVPTDDNRRTVAMFERIVHGRHWSGVRDLQFWRSTITFQPAPHEYVARLANAPLLSGLHTLSLMVEMPDLRPLTTNPRLGNLRTFGAWGCMLPIEAADAIGSATFVPTLEELNLSLNRLGDDGAERLASVAWPELRSLDLGCNELSDIGVRNLLPLVPQLTDLSLASGTVTDAGARELADAIDPEKLKSLWLSYNPLSPAVVAELRDRFGERFHFTTQAEDAARSY